MLNLWYKLQASKTQSNVKCAILWTNDLLIDWLINLFIIFYKVHFNGSSAIQEALVELIELIH